MRYYQTHHSNEVHQFLVTPSRHLYVLKDGRLKWQKTRIDPRLQKFSDAAKNQVIHFIIRDYYSQAMYAEIHLLSEGIKPESFLWQAWSKKEDFPFCGFPEALILPKSLSYLASPLQRLGIQTFKPTGGFQAGVRIFRHWEEHLQFLYNTGFGKDSFPYEPMSSFQELQAKTTHILQTIFDTNSEGESRLSIWKSHLTQLRAPDSQEEFMSYFDPAPSTDNEK